MKHIFITYGDSAFEVAKAKISAQAEATGEFNVICSKGRESLSKELLSSEIINIKRGGGLWSWKPDIILSVMDKADFGDIIVYCDAGCTLYSSSEWKRYWKKLENHDIIAMRIFQRSQTWTRREIINYFADTNSKWLYCYQYQATIILKVSKFSKQFVKEWRDLMIAHPEFAMDVPRDQLKDQLPGFKENRHDQSIYSALIYKYLNNPLTKEKIYTQWEHIEDYDPIFKQAIRATRLRQGQNETRKNRIIAGCKRLVKDYVLKPFYYSPLQWWYSR